MAWLHPTLLLLLLICLPARAEFAFFAWSDQHVSRTGQASHLAPAIAAMNALPGTPYPPGIGGQVAPPAFILNCGDCTDWPTPAAVNAYDRAVSRLRYPTYETLGNHDEAGSLADALADTWTTLLLASAVAFLLYCAAVFLLSRWRRSLPLKRRAIAALLTAGTLTPFAAHRLYSATRPMHRRIIARHGALSYSFDRGGVHFLVVHSLFTPAQTLSAEALAFIRADLATLPGDRPLILATHLSLDAIANKDDLIDCLAGRPVLLILGGHRHIPHAGHYRGIPYACLPSPAAMTQLAVVRVTGTQAIPMNYDYKARRWIDAAE